MLQKFVIIFVVLIVNILVVLSCRISQTTISGTAAKRGSLCSGETIFEDHFNNLNRNLWKHESTLSGGGNWEFQWYSSDPKNSFVRGGKLYIRPTLTSDKFGERYLTSGHVNLNDDPDGCTNSQDYGCSRTGTAQNIINPIRSAQLRTKDSFSFKYGRVQVKAKMPSGDWLWPAIWLFPTHNVYGGWPISGEIDIVESRGNRNMKINRKNAGPEHIGAALHFGPAQDVDGYTKAHYVRTAGNGRGYNRGFHLYEMEWTPDYIKFKVDNVDLGVAHANRGFFARGGFPSNLNNPWRNGARMAPFDQEFHIVLNLAVGGVNGYFPDHNVQYRAGKPWSNESPRAATDFWDGRGSWQGSWNLQDPNNYDSCLIVDYVKVFAL